MQLMKIIKAGCKYLTNQNYRFLFKAGQGKYNDLPDEEYLKRMFKAKFGYELDLENPKTFSEKLQWLKLYDRKDEYTMMVDKYAVREYIAKTIGEEYLIPLLGVWDKPDDIDFDALPDKFVLKCNHNSGLGMFICKDKSKLDIEEVKKELKKGLSQDYYLHGREWPYKNVPRRIICEQYMEDESGELADYKIHMFNGEPKFILVCKNRFSKSGITESFFDLNWEKMDIKRPNIPNAKGNIDVPKSLDKMLELSKKFSKGIPFLRVDFYEINGQPYFGELTFSPASGLKGFEPPLWDRTFGDWIKLPEK